MTVSTQQGRGSSPILEGAPTRPAGLFSCRDLKEGADLGCDVVIVGSGAGGATLGAELAEAGLDVIILEEGGYNPTESFNSNVREMIGNLYRDAGASASLGNPPVLFQEGRTVGGSAVINGGMSWRTPEAILEEWVRDAGIHAASPKEMEPFFERVEKRINVAYQDPHTIGRDNALLKEGAAKKDWLTIDNRRNQLHCAGTNNCAFGCPTGAKRSPLVTYVPRALAFGARIYSHIRVQRITRKGKRATGVEGRVVLPGGRQGAKVRVRAKLVVSACGSIQTPALLSRSRFRSPSKQLGRNLSMHPNAKVVAVFDEDVRGWEGVHQAYQVRQFRDEGFLMAAVNIPPSILAMTAPSYGPALAEMMNEYHRTVVAGILVEDTTLGRVVTLPGGTPVALYQVNDRDAANLLRGTELLCELLFDAGARKIYLPFDGVPPVHSPHEARKVLQGRIPKGAMEIVTVHLMGTARMGRDRTSAVCDSYGMVYDADRLMICDASLFPTPIGVNPCQTIQTLATRNAAYIINNLARTTS